ncbi:MAG: GNAT family N-acetyltransferase [Acidimicrobiia bacterium]
MPPDLPEPLAVRAIPAAATVPLRAEVLRPGQPREALVYPGDDDPATVHFGGFVGERVVGIASLYAEDRVDGPGGGWRLRGMATAPSARGRGAGAALLAAAVDHAARGGGSEVWCNARIEAVGFYRRAGFEVVSEEFDIAGIGAHVVMRRAL